MATLKKILSPKTEEPETKSSSANAGMKAFLAKPVHYNDVIPEERPISSGSLILDAAFTVRSGMIIRLVGKGAELGKTAQSFVFMENYLKTFEGSKGIYVKAEGRLSKPKLEKAGLKFVYTLDEWEAGTVFVVCSNIAEPVFQMLVDSIKCGFKAGIKIAWIIDSMDGLILQDDLETKGMSSGMVAGVPKLTKLLFRHLALPNAHYDSLGMITGQYAAQIKASQYSPTSPNQGSSSNGSSAQHQADYVFEYQSIREEDYILEKPKEKHDPENNKILGKNARIKILKSADDVSGYIYEVPIRKGQEYVGASQIWREKEIADLIVSLEMAQKSTSWFTFSPDILEEAKQKEVEVPEKVQGMNGIYKLLEEPKVYEFFAAKIKEMISDE